MADITVTAANVNEGVNASLETLVAGEAITAGQVIRKLGSDGKAYLADVDATDEATVRGIALNDCAAEQRVTIQRGGTVDGMNTVQGTPYFASDTPGGFGPAADIGSSDVAVYLGIGNAANGLELQIHNSGIAPA